MAKLCRNTCALTGRGVEELRTACIGRRSLFIGHSGVGKSTLLRRLAPGHDLLLGDTPEAFVRETARALLEPALRSHLEQEGMKTVHARLSWPRLGQELRDYYAKRFGA